MASPLEYNSITKNFLSSEPFLQSSVDERESMIRKFTDEYVNNNPDLGAEDVSKIYEVAQIRNNTQRQFDNAGRKTPSPEELQASGLQIPDITTFKNVDDGVAALEQFKDQVEKTTTFDPLNEKDYKFTLGRYANELERELRGEKTGPLVDKGYRFMQGIAGGFIRSVGADEAAEEFETNFFPENIAYDETRWSKFSQAGGDFVASSVIFLATTALTKNPELGLAASIGTTGIRRYQDSYRQVFADTGNEYLAQDAALATLPAAAIEGFGERIIFGKFLGKEGTKQFAEVFRGARGIKAKQEALMSAFRDTSKRKAIYQGFVGEGFTESAGDAYAGLAMAEITGNKDYIPSLGELGETFVISGILGGGAGGTFQGLSNISPQSQQIREDAKQVQQLLKEGKSIEAAQLTRDINSRYEVMRSQGQETINLGTSQESVVTKPPVVDREAVSSLRESSINWDNINRNNRADAWFEGSRANEAALSGFNDALANGGNTLSAHGMSKEGTLSGAVDNLLGLLQNGLDPTRRGGKLDTAPLVTEAGGPTSGTTSGGSAYSDGPFVLVAKPGQNLSGDLSGLGAVLVNEANSDITEQLRTAIQSIRPDIIVAPYSDAGNVTTSLLTKNVQPLQFDPKVREEVAKLDQINKLEDDISTIQAENLLKKPTKEGRTVSKKGEALAAPLTEEQQNLKAELEAALPNRQRVFSEFDTLAKEVENISPEQIAVEKRYWDHLAKVYASKTGLTVDSFYENIAIQPTEQVGKSKESKGSSIGVNLESGKDIIPETFSETEKVDLVFSEIANKVGDVSTLHHELWHSLRLSGIPNKVLEPVQMQSLEAAYNLERNAEGEAVWTRDADEQFARDYETWLRNPGQSLGKFDSELKSIFTKIKDWMREIYRVLARPLSIKQSKSGATIADINPDVRKAFEALHQINPEFLAQDPTLETETEQVGQEQRTSALKGFKTSKGSSYEILEGGATKRNKAKIAGHPDSGQKDPSQATVYIDQATAEALHLPDGEVIVTKEGTRKHPFSFRVVFHPDKTLSLAIKNKDGKFGISPSQRNLKYQNDPALGLFPLELFDFKKGEGFSKLHVGHDISELIQDQRTSALPEGPSVVDGVIKNSPENESTEVADNISENQGQKKAPEALLQSNDKQQRMKEAVNAQPVYEQTDADKKRLKWLNSLNTTQQISKNLKTGLDSSYAKLLKEFAALGNIVTKDEELGNTFFNLLENFHNSRRVVASPDQRAFGPNPNENQGNVTQDAINHLKGYYDQALNLWFKDQQAKYSDVIQGFNSLSLEDFGSRSAVVSWINQQINDNARADNYDEGDQEQESDPYGDIIIDYVNQLNGPEYQAPTLTNVVRLGRGLFNRHIKLQNRFVDYLKGITPELVATMSNAEKVLHFYAMDNLVQDNSYVGASLLLNNDVNKDLNPDVVARNKNKFRPQFKGLFSKVAGNLRSNDLNLKTLALYQEQREFLRSLAKDFEQIGIGEYQEASKHLRDTLTQLRRKHFGRLGPDLKNLYRLGIFSKLIQTPSDLDENQKNEYVRNSYEDILASIEELKKGTDEQVATSVRLNSLLNEITDGLKPDFGFREVSEVAGGNLSKAELGYLNDVIGYLDQYSEVFKFVTEFVHGKPFRYMDNYAPTEQIPNNPSKADKDSIKSLSIEGQHLDLNNFKDPHTQIKTSQVTTSMQRNRRLKGFHYNFNFDSLVERKSRLTLFDIFTAYDRKLLAAKLRSNQLLDILTPNEREIIGQNRVDFLTEMYKNTVHAELHENAYYNEIERGFNFMFHKLGAVALSSIHNAVSQPLAAFSHHLFRNPIATRHYPQAMMAVTKAIANEMSGSTNPNDVGNKIRNLLNIGMGERNILGDPLLNQSHLLSADANIIKRALNTTIGKYTKLANRYIENIQFGPLRLGDISSARTIFLSEYVQSEIEAGRASSFNDVDWDVINTDSLSVANRAVDENVNASRNSRRGSSLARPMSVMRLLTLFSSHRINVATEAANALRDLNEGVFNVAKNVARGEKISPQDVQATKDAISYIAAAIAQSVTFTSAKYGINAGIAVAIVKALQGIYDDEDEFDAKEVELIQDNIDDFKRFNQDPLALRQSLLRDSTGNLIWISSFGGLDNAIYTNVADPVFKHFHELGQKDILEYYNEEIARARRQKKKRTVAILLAQKKAVEDQKYIPLGFGKFSGADVGGAYGALANNIMQPLGEATKWTVSDEEFDPTELVMLSSVFGLGQADLNRMLRAVDKIQDDVNDKRTKEREKEPVR